MERSIRKSISVGEFNAISISINIPEEKRAALVLKLFDENVHTDKTYLLKTDIRTLDEFEKKIQSILSDKDHILGIKNCFQVQDDLHIPKDLKEILLNSNNIAFFIGAGVSRLMEIPLWNELANRAIKYLRGKNYLNYSEELKLQNEKYQAKQILSIFNGIVSDKNEIRKFYQENLNPNTSCKNPYELIGKIEDALKISVVKITTNLDSEWEKCLIKAANKSKSKDHNKPNVITFNYKETQYLGFRHDQEIRGDILYQIHGSLKDIDNAILTTEKYIENYRDDIGLKGFLKQVFKKYTVIFIGSGINEFEILEHCLKTDISNQHYSLIATQMEERNLWRVKKAYFNGINIKAIPYYLDFQEYERLLFVLDSWAEELNSSKTSLFYNNVKFIDEVL
jgi:NAD-dependent SIR2 family protein deacetylase